jgi:predicted RNA binding protein YcfA (HicA-like mRNA interferase family)
MKRRDLERHLRAHGAVLVHEAAKHSKWQGPGGQRSTVPRHNDIGPGLAVAICQQLGIPKPATPR